MNSGNPNQRGKQNGSPEPSARQMLITIALLRERLEKKRIEDLYNRFDLEATRRERDFLRTYLNKLLDDIDNGKK